jgi:hypothetical protein
MRNKILIFLIFLIPGYTSIALAEDINITDADYIWNLTLENATNVSHLVGEPGVMVVRYADVISYTPMENADNVSHLVGEPGVMVVRYADVISYRPLENADNVSHLVGEPGVMIVRYADVISYETFDNPTGVGKRELEINITYPQHGALITNSTIEVNGTAYSPNNITSVMVNGIPANGTTSWNATIPLTFGINTIRVNVTTNTSFSAEKSIQVFHYTTDIRLFGDFNGNGELDSGDVTILMRKIVGLPT